MGRDGGAETIEKSRGGRGRAAGEEVGGTSIAAAAVNVQMLSLLLKEVFILTLP